MYAENAPVVKSNKGVLPGEFYTKEANGKIPDNYKYPLVTIQVAQNQKQSKAGGLTKLLNWDIQNRLINGQTGNNRYTEFAQPCVGKVCLKFSNEQAVLKAIRSFYFGR